MTRYLCCREGKRRHKALNYFLPEPGTRKIANTLRAFQMAHDEMKSDDRDKAEEYYQRGAV